MRTKVGLELVPGSGGNDAFSPEQMKLARQRLGMTFVELADSSNLSLRSVRAFEKGEKAPSDRSETLLTKALDVGPGYFRKPSLDSIDSDSVSFRKLSKTSARKRDAALAYARLIVRIFEMISEQLVLPSRDVPSYEGNPELAAARLREDWGLGDRPISNLLRTLESRGIRVAALPFAERDIDAFCFEFNSQMYILLNTGKTGERQRFDLAHELGHLVLHSSEISLKEESKKRESEANRFAANFLMPSRRILMQDLKNADLDLILQAKTYWKVSATAMTHRLHELELLSDWQYRNVMIELSRLGYRKSEPKNPLVPEKSLFFSEVLYGDGPRISIRQISDLSGIHQGEVKEYLNGLVAMAL